jgi:hypothetical protein
MAGRRKGTERRASNRPQKPSCPICGAPAEDVAVTNRTAYFVFLKCGRCRNVWTLDIPNIPWATPSRKK